MTRWMLIAMLALALTTACNSKKSDVELFAEGPVYINMSADPRRGYEPLYVNFSAYLETKENIFADEISEVKWLIRGPDGYKNEVIQSSFNYQEEDANEEDFFYFEHTFSTFGRYSVQLILNNGQYKSNPFPITVWEKPDNAR